MTRAVIDTNLLVSGLLNETGAPAKLILRWLKGQFDILISDEIVAEYVYILHHLPEVDRRKAEYLVTQNTKHFPRKSYQDVRIVKVSKFLEELEKQFLN